ncbi:MAG: tRNA (adenosine(37)-N6)-dimethylallyltransferase MiaA [Methylobacteriaceae bacterium]|nr:tRNA (adenosine(37)-N6)-dimethylallyltransferase MiaA [Methylobacteriaceae bacterium]
MYSAILIAGPTASGKSALALHLAERLGGAIINADSMQVYRDLRILTARPSQAEEARLPHLLFGTIDGGTNFSVGQYLAAASAALETARSVNHIPIFVGGTGLYFKALLQGLSDIPAVPAAIRAHVREEAAGLSAPELYARLAGFDPQSAARLRPSDPQRILRALEVFAATGQSLAFFQGVRAKPLLDAQKCLCLFIAPPRAALRASIDTRFDEMLAGGALAEVEALKDRKFDPALPIMRAHGVPHLIAHLDGRLTLEEATRLGKRDTRAYVKRQFTFARHQLKEFLWIAPDQLTLRASAPARRAP